MIEAKNENRVDARLFVELEDAQGAEEEDAVRGLQQWVPAVAGPHQLGGPWKEPLTEAHSSFVIQEVPDGQTGLEDVEEVGLEEVREVEDLEELEEREEEGDDGQDRTSHPNPPMLEQELVESAVQHMLSGSPKQCVLTGVGCWPAGQLFVPTLQV